MLQKKNFYICLCVVLSFAKKNYVNFDNKDCDYDGLFQKIFLINHKNIQYIFQK